MDVLQIGKIIVNTILVSIPEEIFFVLFVYIMMGEFDHWKDEDCKKLFYPWDYSRILVPAIFSAVISNILRYGGASSSIVSFGTIFSLFISIVAMGDIFNNARALKWIREVLLFLLLGSTFTAVVEFPYIYFLVYGIGIPLIEINNHLFLNFIATIPLKLVEYSLLIFLVVRKRSKVKLYIFSEFYVNKILAALVLTILLVNVSFFVFMLKVICYGSYFHSPSISKSIVVLVVICIIPIINLFVLFGSVYYVKNTESIQKKDISKKIMKIIAEIKIYSDKEKYEDINWTLHGLKSRLIEISDSLYSERE